MRFCLLGCLLLTACCGFSHVNDGSSGGDTDMAGGGGGSGGGGDDVDMAGGGGSGGGGGTGGSGGGGGNMSCTSGCGCGAAVLLVAVKSVNGATSNDGRVLQLTLPVSGLATPCGPQLTAAGSLSKSPTAIGWMPPDSVLWGSSESVLVLDGVHDQIKVTYRPTQSGDVPLALFRLTRPAGLSDVLGIGYNTHGGDTIDTLTTIDPKSGAEVKVWDVQNASGPLYLHSSVQAMARDPFDSSRIAYVDNGIQAHPAMQSALPWDAMPVTPNVWYATRPPGSYPSTLQTLEGAVKRAVWAQTSSSSTSDDVIYEIDDDGTGPQLYGPLKCAVDTLCKQPFKTTDAAPDPTQPQRVLATCDAPTTNVKHVVRIDSNGCTQVVDGSKLLSLTYPVALAVGAAR